MTKLIFILKPIFLFLILMTFLLSYSCKKKNTEVKSFSREVKAVKLADKMLEAIGGKTRWCELKSLYIKAIHTEPQMNIPYQSEIWRGIDRLELVIEQQNDSFHVKAVVNSDGGTVRYFDKRDTSRNLTVEQLKSWEFDHNHNIYVLLHNIACKPENYTVSINDKDRLAFHQDSTFIASFSLDDQFRPYLFYKANIDGSISGSTFTEWGTHQGLVHSAGGHPLDSNFIYKTEIWEPNLTTLEEKYGEKLFDLD